MAFAVRLFGLERRIVRHCYGRAGRRYYRLRVRVAHDHDGTSIHGIERYAQGEHARDAGTLFRPIDRFSNIHRLRPFIVNCGHCTKNGDRKYSICKILYYPHTNYDIIKPDENHALFPSGWKHKLETDCRWRQRYRSKGRLARSGGQRPAYAS